MENRVKKALQDFDGNYNCSQSVFKQYACELGISEDQAIRTAAGFGGGMRCGHTCGVVTGAIMVLGLRHGKENPTQEDKEALCQIVKDFTHEFINIHGSTHCKDLIGYDTGSDEGRRMASEEGRFRERCPKFIQTSIELLDK